MVRVVSCHHFVSQDVFLSEQEPAAHCSAQEKFLVATAQNFVNVHDLDSRGKILHTFPTVDVVANIIYCESGNYVATIEKKITRYSNAITYVRIYFNWWIEARGQPLKVRVAGCPPASTDRQPWNNQFEMVELPLEEPAISIACCRKTSSLAVSLGKVVSVFYFTVKTNDDSCQKFSDFEHLMNIKMYFTVKELSICENYLACMSDKIIQVFKVIVEKDDVVGENIPELDTMKNNDELYSDDFVEWRFESCLGNGSSDVSWEKHLKSTLHSNSFPISISLPTIERENEKFSSSEASELHGPLLTVKGCIINVKFNVKVFEMFPSLSSNVKAVTLLYKQFSSVDGSSCDLMKHQLVPFYSCEMQLEGPGDPLSSAVVDSEKMLFSLPWLNINAEEASHLKAMGCFFTTCQEGFLYDVSHKTKLITRYAYTATLKGVALETTLLHALTETGLETYTMHLPHSALQHIENADGIKNIVPNFEDAVCLLGLRPFLGVDHLAISDNHIILVSSTEDSVANNDANESNSCTLYSLKKPPPAQVFSDLLEMAELHQSSSPTTYYHLLSEAHVILRAHLFLNNVQSEVYAFYVKSCLLLADYFICSDASEILYAVPYYHLSKLPPNSIVQRISDFQSKVKPACVLKSLIHYLNSVLFDDENKLISEISQPCAEIILSAYSEEAPESLWKVILCSKLNGYKYDRAILMLKRRMTSKRHPLSPASNASDTLALVSLLLKKTNMEAAQNMLLSLTKVDLVAVLKSVHNTLWNGINFTVLGKFLKQVRPDAFVELLLTMIDNNNMQVSDIILMLKNDSPHSALHSVPLLKEFLEASLNKKVSANLDETGSNLLVKIYMKRLLELNENTVSFSSPFSGNVCAFTLLFGSRPTWLNEMPPFNGNGISRSCLKNLKDYDKNVNEVAVSLDCCCWACNEDLLRLQSLLSFLGPSDRIKEQVLEFLCSANEKNSKWISLEVMCSNETQAIKILIESAPKALLPYAKENFNLQQKKWYILFALLHEHVKILPEDHPLSNIYSLTFNGVLSHLAETLKPVEFLELLPKGEDPTFLPHVQRCIEKHQADQLRTKIVSLGQEIKSMM